MTENTTMLRALRASARENRVVEHFMLFALLTAVLLAVFGVLSASKEDFGRNYFGTQEKLVEVSSRDALVYQDGAWLADGRRVALPCMTESSCTVQWVSGTRAWLFASNN